MKIDGAFWKSHPGLARATSLAITILVPLLAIGAHSVRVSVGVAILGLIGWLISIPLTQGKLAGYLAVTSIILLASGSVSALIVILIPFP